MYFEPQPKPTTLRDPKYLKWLAKQPPLIAGTGDTVYHHIKFFKSGAMGKKPSDTDAIPIAHSVHQQIHSSGRNGGERNVLLKRHKYTVEILRDVCNAYYRVYCREVGKNPCI